MRIVCVFVSLTIVLVLSSGCLAEEEKRGRAEPKVRKADAEAKKAKPLRKKVEVKKPRYTFPALEKFRKQLMEPSGLAHLTEEQARELFKKLMPLIKRMHRLEKQINKIETRANILMKQGKVEKAMIFRFKGLLLKNLLRSLDGQVDRLRATYRKKKRKKRTNP
jgi:hypothetical protein